MPTYSSEALNGVPGTRDIWPKWSQDQGHLAKMVPGTRTIYSIFSGTRDHMTRCGWDQGPNQKNWPGPGTIATPHTEPHGEESHN